MKRSKKIQLVLITATFASCNHRIQPEPSGNTDWVYACGYPYLTDDCDSTTLYRQTLPYNLYNNWFYTGHSIVTRKVPVPMKGSVVRNSRFVKRGGFGGHGFASS